MLIKSFFIAILSFEGYHLLSVSTALNGELTDGTRKSAVLAKGKCMANHYIRTSYQFGDLIHLTVFYNYSSFHTI